MQFFILVYVNFVFQLESHPQQPKSKQLKKLEVFKAMLERLITFLQVSKNNITPSFKEKLGSYEKQIVSFLNLSDTTKRLMSFPKCRSVEVINNPARPGSNHREVNCINYR